MRRGRTYNGFNMMSGADRVLQAVLFIDVAYVVGGQVGMDRTSWGARIIYLTPTPTPEPRQGPIGPSHFAAKP